MNKSKINIWRDYRGPIALWLGILVLIVISLKLGIDKKILVFFTLLLGLFTQVFTGLWGIVAAIPLVGPFIVKILTIPFFWMVNALSHIVGVVAIKKGYGKEYIKSRFMTLALLIGMIIGYILGHLLPLR